MDNTHAVNEAIRVLNDGGVIIYPTDTAFGIGCRIDNVAGVDRLFRIRRRPRAQATPVLVDSESMALSYLTPPKYIVRHFMKTYWPGGLTIIAPCQKEKVYSPIRGGGDTIGLRMPNHETALRIIAGVGVPILGPSANMHGNPTPYLFSDLDPELVSIVDYVVPGICTAKMASTVVDCSVEPYKIIRQGAVTLI